MARYGELARKYRSQVAVIVALASALILLFISYDNKRFPTLNIGAPGDSPFLTGFYADEPDIDFRYRWTKPHAKVIFTGAGSARPEYVLLRAQGPRQESVTQPITASFALNDLPLEPSVITLTSKIDTYYFSLPDGDGAPGVALSPPYRVAIDSSTFNPPGDNRALGIKVDQISLYQGTNPSYREGNYPPLDVVCWWLVLVAGLLGLFSALRPGIIASLVIGTLPTLLAFANQSLLPAVFLPPVAFVVGVAGLLVWQRWTISVILPVWGRFRERLVAYTRPTSVSSSATSAIRSRAGLAMLAALLLFAALSIWTIPQVAWIGHADYAENANVARSLVEGRGLTVDYVAQFYQDHPAITHPAETWPLLQPLLTAPFFALFGPQTWAARLPNLFILLALAWGVFAVGSRLWGSRVGLVAGLLTLLHAYFFNSVLYPINDLVFTAIFFALAWLVFRTVDGGLWTAVTPQSMFRTPHLILIGVLAGLLIWSKPSGAVLLVGLGLWVGWGWSRDKYEQAAQTADVGLWRIPWRGLLIAGGAFALVLLPLVVRNLFAFGAPFYSTEGLDAWILRYWPLYEWENIYKYYVGSELPHPRWVVGGKFGYANLFDAIGINFRWVWEKGVMSAVSSSEFVLGPIPLAGALLGMLVAPRRALRLAGMALFSIALYALVVLLYWHFEGRYFQVAIPWLYLLLAGAVVWLSDIVGKAIRGVAGQVVSTMLLAAMTAALLWPQVASIGNFLVYDTRPTSFTVAMEWLTNNSAPDDVVMTRDPWELNWYTRRKAVMIPFDNLDTILSVAGMYGVTMLQLGGPTDGIDVETCPPNANASRFPTGSRPALGKLYCGYELPGLTRIYKNGDLTIYRLKQ